MCMCTYKLIMANISSISASLSFPFSFSSTTTQSISFTVASPNQSFGCLSIGDDTETALCFQISAFLHTSVEVLITKCCFWEFLFLLNHYVILISWFLTGFSIFAVLCLVSFFVFFEEYVFSFDNKTVFLFCANLLHIVSCVGFFGAFLFVFLQALVPFLILLP